VPYPDRASGSHSLKPRKGHCYRASGRRVSFAQALPSHVVISPPFPLNKVIRMRTLTARAVIASVDAPARTDIPRTPRLNREQREAWVMALYLGGATVDEIAFVLGTARTSIRQTVMDTGVARHRGTRNIDVLMIMREVRLTGTLTLKEVAARIGYSEETVRQSIAALGMTESVRRLFRLRRRAARRVAIANADRPRTPVTLASITGRRSTAVRVA
jgi:hypothetical protein